MNTVGKLDSYRIAAFTWFLSSTRCKRCSPGRGASGRYLAKNTNRNRRFQSLFTVYWGRPREALKTWGICSDPVSCSARFSLVKNVIFSVQAFSEKTWFPCRSLFLCVWSCNFLNRLQETNHKKIKSIKFRFKLRSGNNAKKENSTRRSMLKKLNLRKCRKETKEER